MISTVEINKSVDFEVNWEDVSSQPLDMDDVTFELYHYNPSSSAEIISTAKEPFIIAEMTSDSLGVSTLNISGTGTIAITSTITLELNIIVDQLEGLGCPPNDFVVPNTNNKVSIIGGQKVFALSACELASLINLQASGYYAESREGFLVLKTATSGALTQITLDFGTINPTLGLSEGTSAVGSDLAVVSDIAPTLMTRISTGKYVYPNVLLSDTAFSPDKRYYVNYKAVHPISLLAYTQEEDFIIIKSNMPKYTFSFTR